MTQHAVLILIAAPLLVHGLPSPGPAVARIGAVAPAAAVESGMNGTLNVT